VSKRSDDTLAKIEETQAELRDSIEKARELADASEQLIRQHRDEIGMPEPEEGASSSD
jgi:hypothetical protein